jgi:hypothetical protein
LLTPVIAAIASLAGVYFQCSSLGLRQRVKQRKKIPTWLMRHPKLSTNSRQGQPATYQI